MRTELRDEELEALKAWVEAERDRPYRVSRIYLAGNELIDLLSFGPKAVDPRIKPDRLYCVVGGRIDVYCRDEEGKEFYAPLDTVEPLPRPLVEPGVTDD